MNHIGLQRVMCLLPWQHRGCYVATMHFLNWKIQQKYILKCLVTLTLTLIDSDMFFREHELKMDILESVYSKIKLQC